MFYLLLGIAILSDGTTWAFYGVQNELISTKYGLDNQEVANIIGIHFII